MIRTRTICKFFNSPWMALFAILGLPLSAPAAWLGYKNDTKSAIVVQTSINVNGRIINGKVHTLYPGEVAWDNIPAAGARQVAVADKTTNRILASENINIQNQDVFLSAQTYQPPQVPGKTAVPPAVRLVAIKAPVAPGTVPEKPKTNPNPNPNQPVPKGNLPPTVTPKAPETPKGKTPEVPKGKLPPTVGPATPTPNDAPKEAPKESPKEAPKSPPPQSETPKSKSG